MVNVRPERGGFMRPFGCGWFIREFLAGRAPEGAPAIDPDVGAPQQDIKFAYKEALYRAMARDRASREISARVLRGEDITEEEAARIERYHYEQYSSLNYPYAMYLRWLWSRLDSNGIVAHFALHPSCIVPAPAGHDPLFQDFVEHHFMQRFPVLRGEKR